MTQAIDLLSSSRLQDQVLIDGVTAGSWDYADAETQNLTHNIHRYSGKFIPQIARRAISLLTVPGERILDPYCGSGTTLVESALLGRRAHGVDLSPLAVLIARTKVTPVATAGLERLKRELEEALAPLEFTDALPLFGTLPAATALRADVQHDLRTRDKWFCKWFQPHVLCELIAIDQAIWRIADGAMRNVALVALSNILRKSSNAHSGYPNVMFDNDAPVRVNPLRSFLSSLDSVCAMVGSLEKTGARWEEIQVDRGNAASLDLRDCSVDAVVSHPPYIGSIPYAEYGALSLKWLGADPRELDSELTGGKRQSSDVVDRFRQGYGKMLCEVSRVLRPGRYVFLMVGNPVVRGKSVDLAAMTLRLAQDATLEPVIQTERRGVNRRANKMGVEHLLFFKKPA